MKNSVSCARRVALFLALCLAGGSVLACGQTEVEVQETDALQTESIVVETEPARPAHSVPEMDFAGETFHSYALDWQGYCFYFFAEEATGDAMNDTGGHQRGGFQSK